MSKFPIAFIAVLLLLFACNRHSSTGSDHENDSPEDRLKGYISKSFVLSTIGERDDLVKYLTGEAADRLKGWTDQQFKDAFLEAKRTFIKFQIFEVKKLAKDQINIVYELAYMDQSRGKDAKVTQKKLCQMVQKDGTWLIREVQSIKELVEFRNELSLP